MIQCPMPMHTEHKKFLEHATTADWPDTCVSLQDISVCKSYYSQVPTVYFYYYLLKVILRIPLTVTKRHSSAL